MALDPAAACPLPDEPMALDPAAASLVWPPRTRSSRTGTMVPPRRRAPELWRPAMGRAAWGRFRRRDRGRRPPTSSPRSTATSRRRRQDLVGTYNRSRVVLDVDRGCKLYVLYGREYQGVTRFH